MTGERLPEPAAKRVLDRASALDAQQGAMLPVDALRDAARQAGISPEAFEAALAEERRGVAVRTTGRRRPALIAVAFLLAVLAGGLGYAGMRRTRLAVENSEVRFTLKCADVNEVAERLRTSLKPNAATSVRIRAATPRVLAVRADADAMATIRATVQAAEVEAATCVVPPG